MAPARHGRVDAQHALRTRAPRAGARSRGARRARRHLPVSRLPRRGRGIRSPQRRRPRTRAAEGRALRHEAALPPRSRRLQRLLPVAGRVSATVSTATVTERLSSPSRSVTVAVLTVAVLSGARRRLEPCRAILPVRRAGQAVTPRANLTVHLG